MSSTAFHDEMTKPLAGYALGATVACGLTEALTRGNHNRDGMAETVFMTSALTGSVLLWDRFGPDNKKCSYGLMGALALGSAVALFRRT